MNGKELEHYMKWCGLLSSRLKVAREALEKLKDIHVKGQDDDHCDACNIIMDALKEIKEE